MFVNHHRLASRAFVHGVQNCSMCSTPHFAVTFSIPSGLLSTTSDSTISPAKEDLKASVASLNKEHPALGITKLHALLLSENPSWAVSEKCLRRILINSNSDGPLAQHQGLEYYEPSWGQ
ncbi:hypothetical protein V8E52_004381 [Russula decolorans]